MAPRQHSLIGRALASIATLGHVSETASADRRLRNLWKGSSDTALRARDRRSLT